MGELAAAEAELAQKTKDLKQTEAELKALVDYLAEIRPGCDFITENIATRTSNREKETQALKSAVEMIRGTPAYKDAVAAAHKEGLGDCADTCAENEEHVDC